jgi:hypothetical protein
MDLSLFNIGFIVALLKPEFLQLIFKNIAEGIVGDD